MIVAVVLAVTALLIVLFTYNGLMQHRQDVRTAWSQMDDQLKRRYDLVPSLMHAVQPAGGETAAKLTGVIAAKNQAAIAFNPTQLAVAEADLSIAIQQVLTSASADPALHGNAEFVEVSRQLAASEKAIEQARQRYNQKVDSLNAAMFSFPSMFTAWAIGLHPQPFFELPT